MNKININTSTWLKIIKIAAGSCLAIILADLLGLSYSASAGIITLLSIQDTKKETLKVAIKRFAAFATAVLIALIIFQSLGYHPVTFGLFLLFFVTASYLFHITEGIPMCSVLVSHFLIEQNMSLAFIGNEVAILGIGIIIGVILNLYMPDNTGAVLKDIVLVEEEVKDILRNMAAVLRVKNRSEQEERNDTAPDRVKMQELDYMLSGLEEHLNLAQKQAYENMNNTLLTDTRYYIGYFTMRKEQVLMLKQTLADMKQLNLIPKQAYPLAYMLDKIKEQFRESNNARELIKELNRMKELFKEEPVPTTREEFENRAILYGIMNNIESFLMIKRDFVDSVTERQIERFWKRNVKAKH
ncbi:MAG: hypothetical protein K0R05_1579 [Anaerocolumna sp.]|nr:hypothetical protein [Anaerocolumna sp.]